MSNVFKAANRIHVSKKTGAAFFDLGRYESSSQFAPSPSASVADTNVPADTFPEDSITDAIEYAKWGDDNNKPLKMVSDIKSTGILTGGLDTKIRFGLGTGPEAFTLTKKNADGMEELTPIMDAEILDWAEENNLMHSCFGWMKDMYGLGNDLARMKFTRDGSKIGLLWRHDVAEMRLQLKNKAGQIGKVYLSADWDKGVSMTKGNVITLDLIPGVGPYSWLQDRYPTADKRRSKEFAWVNRLPDWLKHYYSDPNWLSAQKWVEIAKGVPGMKAAMFENNIRLKYMVVIMEEYWEDRFPDWEDEDEAKCEAYRTQVYDEIDGYLVGSEHAYKSIFVKGKSIPGSKDIFKYIHIEPVKDETQAGELLPDSAAANFEILFSIGMSPALIGMNVLGGGSYGGGAGSGSDIRESALVQIMIQSLERLSITRKLNFVSKVNGWKDRYPGMVWRFPGQVLTTLDKGGSTADVKSA
jgi:hypothetical protein